MDNRDMHEMEKWYLAQIEVKDAEISRLRTEVLILSGWVMDEEQQTVGR